MYGLSLTILSRIAYLIDRFFVVVTNDEIAIFVDVRDVALLHVAALLDPSIEGTRLPAWGYEFNWNDILKILQQLDPGKALPAALDNPGEFNGTADVAQAKHALKRWGGQDDFISLEKGVIDTLNGPSVSG